MAVLTIQPLHYQENKLGQVGEKVVQAFYPLLTDFIIEPEIRPGGLEIAIDAQEAGLDIPLGLGYRVEFPDGTLVAGLDFLRFLVQSGKTVLAITSLPVFIIGRGQLNPVYGQASGDLRSGYVSANVTELQNVERLSVVAIHEVGHIEGLQHHRGEQKTSGGKLCPMTTAHGERIETGGLTIEQYFTLRGSLLCGECYGALGLTGKNPMTSQRKQFVNGVAKRR